MILRPQPWALTTPVQRGWLMADAQARARMFVYDRYPKEAPNFDFQLAYARDLAFLPTAAYDNLGPWIGLEESDSKLRAVAVVGFILNLQSLHEHGQNRMTIKGMDLQGRPVEHDIDLDLYRNFLPDVPAFFFSKPGAATPLEVSCVTCIRYSPALRMSPLGWSIREAGDG